MGRIFHYTKIEDINPLRTEGIQPGDVVFSHVCMGMLGYPQEASTEWSACRVICEGLMEVIGDDGTPLIPTFGYSFCKEDIVALTYFKEFFFQQDYFISHSPA
jgi:aminoglycoside 3-N-acetyltransferase